MHAGGQLTLPSPRGQRLVPTNPNRRLFSRSGSLRSCSRCSLRSCSYVASSGSGPNRCDLCTLYCQKGDIVPEQQTLERARRDAREGKSPSTQAGEFVREEIEHIREGKHRARSTKQAIAIGLSKARRAGVKLPAPKAGQASARTRKQAEREIRGTGSVVTHSSKRSHAASRALKKEGRSAASPRALAIQAKQAARKRSPEVRSQQAKRAARTSRTNPASNGGSR